MFPRVARVTTAVAVAVVASTARAAERTVALPDVGKLTLAVPDGWTADADGGPLPTVTVHATPGHHASVQMTPLPVRGGGKPTDADLKRAALRIGAQYAAGSVQKKATAQPIRGDYVRGSVCAFTDAAADPGEFRFVTAGVVAVDGQLFAVTVLSGEAAGADHDAAVAAVRTATFAAAVGPAAATRPTGLRARSLDGTWAVVVPGPWRVVDDQADQQQRQVTATDAAGGWVATAFVEPAARAGGDAKAARAFYVARMRHNPIPMTHLRRADVGDVAVVEYDQDAGGGVPDHNVNAYLSHGGCWVDVHLSKAGYAEATDRAVLDAVLKGIAVDVAARVAK